MLWLSQDTTDCRCLVRPDNRHLQAGSERPLRVSPGRSRLWPTDKVKRVPPCGHSWSGRHGGPVIALAVPGYCRWPRLKGTVQVGVCRYVVGDFNATTVRGAGRNRLRGLWPTIQGLRFRLEIDVVCATRRNDACGAGDAPIRFLKGCRKRPPWARAMSSRGPKKLLLIK